MADQKLSQLPAITGAGLAAGDLFYVDDVSAAASKSIRKDQLATLFDAAGAAAAAQAASQPLNGNLTALAAVGVITNAAVVYDAGGAVVPAAASAFGVGLLNMANAGDTRDYVGLAQVADGQQAVMVDNTLGAVGTQLKDCTNAGVADPSIVNDNFASLNNLVTAIRSALIALDLIKGSA